MFVELGLKPHTELVRDWAELNPEGHIVVRCDTRTSVPGLFAAGDVTHLPAEQVLIAIGEGAKAALAAYEYLLKCWSADGRLSRLQSGIDLHLLYLFSRNGKEIIAHDSQDH